MSFLLSQPLALIVIVAILLLANRRGAPQTLAVVLLSLLATGVALFVVRTWQQTGMGWATRAGLVLVVLLVAYAVLRGFVRHARRQQTE